MNPPIRGQNTARKISEAPLRVQRDLLLGGGERPRDLHPPLLAEHETELARRPQTLRAGRPEGPHGPALVTAHRRF